MLEHILATRAYTHILDGEHETSIVDFIFGVKHTCEEHMLEHILAKRAYTH